MGLSKDISIVEEKSTSFRVTTQSLVNILFSFFIVPYDCI